MGIFNRNILLDIPRALLLGMYVVCVCVYILLVSQNMRFTRKKNTETNHTKYSNDGIRIKAEKMTHGCFFSTKIALNRQE